MCKSVRSSGIFAHAGRFYQSFRFQRGVRLFDATWATEDMVYFGGPLEFSTTRELHNGIDALIEDQQVPAVAGILVAWSGLQPSWRELRGVGNQIITSLLKYGVLRALSPRELESVCTTLTELCNALAPRANTRASETASQDVVETLVEIAYEALKSTERVPRTRLDNALYNAFHTLKNRNADNAVATYMGQVPAHVMVQECHNLFPAQVAHFTPVYTLSLTLPRSEQRRYVYITLALYRHGAFADRLRDAFSRDLVSARGVGWHVHVPFQSDVEKALAR